MIATDLNCEDLGLSRLVLMENAGKSISDEIAKLSTFTFSKPVKIAIFTGSGGNGGDGFVAARHLLNRGFEVDIYLLTPINQIKSQDSKTNVEILKNIFPNFSRINLYEINDSDTLNTIEITKSNSFSEHIIIDGILGTGIKGKLKTKIKKAIEIINNSNALKVSIDVPSGMDPQTGEIAEIGVKPGYTLSLHAVKTGLKKAGEDLTGGLIICDIGIPIEAEIFLGKGDLKRLNKRKNTSHKGNNGKVLIIGGNNDFSGAPSISGLSALSCGVDLLYIASPKSSSLVIKSYSPDFIVKSLKGDFLNINNLNDLLEIAKDVDSILIGPGSGLEEETRKLFNILVAKIKKPIVIDADGLKLIDVNLIKNKENLIITPHFNEFKTFFKEIIIKKDLKNQIGSLDLSFENLNYKQIHDKIAIIQEITSEIKGTIVIKGKYDLIFKGNKIRINKTGNPAMTVGGTGDSLAGIATALLSLGLNDLDSGALSTYLNGKSGDLAYEKYGNGLRASQLSEFIGQILKK
ncbi:bifunctional NAD(P)H-hydrate repair enzyme Nnr [Methanobrevibacter curvatus]|uniref:Bifunctional NAD(P)H-hydrate repair enzyme n=2 Tax=Methanobrevibacter curvatus TaxID=49547 RepID=A0A166C5P3_9EURY|nr:bifunctional NAD(P)H-hydrate repair enzyme Nnr [Methanobrevibacter curvatus]